MENIRIPESVMGGLVSMASDREVSVQTVIEDTLAEVAVRNMSSIRNILTFRPALRLVGITRRGQVVRIFTDSAEGKLLLDTEMAWYPDWNAWSVRLKRGPYQQLCIFEATPYTEDDDSRDAA